MSRRSLLATLVVLSLASSRGVFEAQHAVAKPTLVVLLVVDQMRADYVERFSADWTGGLKRLITQGASFRRAAYPYLSTVTCAGHATISTGSFPHVHGVFQNSWWNRETAKMITCTEDPGVKNTGYTAAVTGGDSAHELRSSTFADEMRRQRSAHVVSLSMKDRSAIMLAGHGGDAVTWLSTALDNWMTSSAFAASLVPAVKGFVDMNPVDADYGRSWARLLPESRYQSADDAVGETPPKGWTRTFPHPLKGSGEKPDADFREQWARSPYADAYVGQFAAALTDALRLGRHDGTDVLAVSFSSTDLVGHAFGPDSQEVQDMLAHLDLTIGILLDRLDTLVGRNAYVVALTSDHGVTPIPEQLASAGKDGGRIDSAAIVDSVERRARSALGAAKYVSRLVTNDLYFEPGMYAQLKAAPAALAAVIDAIKAAPGVERVFRAEELATGGTSTDRLLRAAALSYVPGRSGDLVLVPKTGWMTGPLAATHGSANPDDQRVPLLLMGTAIKPGEYQEPVTPADIAPTLASICGISMPDTEGHALVFALK